MTLERRIEQLESATPPITVWRRVIARPGETSEQAIERAKAEHPEWADDRTGWIVRVLVQSRDGGMTSVLR